MNVEATVTAALKMKGIAPFWQQSVMDNVRRALVTNRYFATGIKNIRITRVGEADTPLARVSRVSATITRYFPDSDTTDTARLVYTFNPNTCIRNHVINVTLVA